MEGLEHKLHNRKIRKHRVRSVVHGTKERPRLSVKITNKHIAAQIIDDAAHKTLVASTTVANKSASGNMTAKAAVIGADIGKKAKAAKIKRIVFDRGSKLYHGRIKVLAEEARKAGLEF